jgi:hypothetical protein
MHSKMQFAQATPSEVCECSELFFVGGPGWPAECLKTKQKNKKHVFDKNMRKCETLSHFRPSPL